MTDDAGRRPIATGSQTVGPFFHFGLTNNLSLGSLATDGVPGDRLTLRVRVLDGDNAAVPDAMVEIYQADAAGAYARPPFTGFGRLPTGEDGACVFQTIRPGAVPTGVQAPHVNVCVFARGLLRHLYTRIYFAGDVGLESDPLMTLVPEDRRQTLLAVPLGGRPDAWEFTIRLQGEGETVFFDL
jgi:protocatechuate 3,4-dioxygenase, alpha subunit